MSNPMKPDPIHAAYVGLILALSAFGLALASLGLTLSTIVR